jgi:hypothetical protein
MNVHQQLVSEYYDGVRDSEMAHIVMECLRIQVLRLPACPLRQTMSGVLSDTRVGGIQPDALAQSGFCPSFVITLFTEQEMPTRKIGRDAGTGKFKPVREAQRDKPGSVVETIKIPPKKKGK